MNWRVVTVNWRVMDVNWEWKLVTVNLGVGGFWCSELGWRVMIMNMDMDKL